MWPALLGFCGAVALALARRRRERVGEDGGQDAPFTEMENVIHSAFARMEVGSEEHVEALISATFDTLNEMNGSTLIQHALTTNASGQTELSITLSDVAGKILDTYTADLPGGGNVGWVVSDLVKRVHYMADNLGPGELAARDLVDVIESFVWQGDINSWTLSPFGDVRGPFLDAIFRSPGDMTQYLSSVMRALEQLGVEVKWDVSGLGGWEGWSYMGRPNVELEIDNAIKTLGRFGLESDSYETILSAFEDGGAFLKQLTYDALSATGEALTEAPGFLEKALAGIGFDEFRVLVMRLQSSFILPIVVLPQPISDFPPRGDNAI